jgi:hypothetical protein
MDSSRYTETADKVLAAVRAKGHKISRAQLTRWHIFGILPRPMQRRREGMRGSETVYPGGTIEQALAAAILLQDRRFFDDVKVELWLLGYAISPAFIACELRDAVFMPLRLKDHMRAAFGKVGKQIEAALGGDHAAASLDEYTDDDLFDLWHREPGIVLRHAEHLIPPGHAVEWDHRVRFISHWLLASKLPKEQQRIAVAAIFLEFLDHAAPIPGLAPKRPRGRPRVRNSPAPRRTRAVA